MCVVCVFDVVLITDMFDMLSGVFGVCVVCGDW